MTIWCICSSDLAGASTSRGPSAGFVHLLGVGREADLRVVVEDLLPAGGEVQISSQTVGVTVTRHSAGASS